MRSNKFFSTPWRYDKWLRFFDIGVRNAPQVPDPVKLYELGGGGVRDEEVF